MLIRELGRMGFSCAEIIQALQAPSTGVKAQIPQCTRFLTLLVNAAGQLWAQTSPPDDPRGQCPSRIF